MINKNVKYAIYARFSSDVQNQSSTADQIHECKRYIERNGGQVVKIYKDDAISGSTQFRPGYQQLLADANTGLFNAVLTESLDRLSRNQADTATMYQIMAFHQIDVVTLADGKVNELHVGIKGTMNALYLKDLRAKTRRGLVGRIREGKNPGSVPYGYEVVKALDADGNRITGEIRRVESELEIVKRIFIEFSDGKSPNEIAKGLNDDNIPAPSGKKWTGITIRGNRQFGNGIINNATYTGRRIWGRTSTHKDPLSGKSVRRVNPESEWIIRDYPELRAISDNLWQSVRARQDEISNQAHNKCISNALTGMRRNKYLFSGLIFCSECGSKFTLGSKNRYVCSNFKKKHGCKSGKSIRRHVIEGEILSVLKDKLLEPGRIQAFIDEYHVQQKQALAKKSHEQSILRKDLRRVEAKINSVMNAIEQDIITSTTKARLIELEAKKTEIESSIVDVTDLPKPDTGLVEDYRALVNDLASALDDEAIKYKAMDLLRPLVDKIILHPTNEGFKAEFHGSLQGMIYGARKKNGFFIPPSQTSDNQGPLINRHLTPVVVFINLPFWPKSSYRK